MSELNVYHHELRHNEYDEFYLKSEADKVIVDKDAKILALDAEVFKQKHHAKLLFDERNYAETQLRHHKFKRCLDKAKICQLRLERYERYVTKYKDCNDPGIQRWRFLKDHYEKWYNRWWKIADQYNPNSTAPKENNNG